MAIANSDGSIILSTKIDTKGLQEAMAKMRQQAKGTGSAFESLSNAIKVQETRLASLRQQYASYVIRNEQGSAAAKKLSKDIKALSGSLAQNQQKLVAASASAVSFGAKAKTAIAGVGMSLKVLASYLIGIQTIFAAINFSKEAGQFATQTEASVQRLVDIYGSASDSVGDFIDANARALGMSKSAAASFSSVYGNLFSVWADQATNAELTNEYLQMTAVVASKTGRTVEDVQERVRSGLLGNTEAIEDLGIFVNVKTIEMTDAFQRMADGKSWEQLDAYTQQQIRSMAILEQATAKYGDEVADTSATIRNRFNAAYQDFQNSWGNIVNTVLLPVLETLTQIFDIVTKGLNALSGRSGQILENVELQEENTDKTAENIEEQTKNQKELNKEIKKSLAGFDDIQILSSQIANNSSDNNFEGLSINNTSVKKENTNDIQEINKELADLMSYASGALVALGLILLVTGNIGWGLGFVIAGAADYAITEASINGENFEKILKDIETYAVIGGMTLIFLGLLMLAVPSMEGYGLRMIATGAVSTFTPIALNGGNLKESISYDTAVILEILGGLSVIVGIILILCGMLPVGIGAIVFGAIAIFGPVAIHWDDMVKYIIEPTIESVKNFIMNSNWAVIILGIILFFTGANPLIGLGLIAQGIVGIASSKTPLWNTVYEQIKNTWEKIKDYWKENIEYVWTTKFWFGLAKIAANGLIDGFESGINWVLNAFENMINSIIDGFNKISFDIPDWVPGIGGKSFGINLPNVKFGRVSIPRLAQGTVVPPNKEFMAVLGDNTKEHEIVSPISTMKQAFMEAMIEMGGAGQTTKEEHYYLNETELMSVMYRLVKGGERLNGGSLIDGGIY